MTTKEIIAVFQGTLYEIKIEEMPEDAADEYIRTLFGE